MVHKNIVLSLSHVQKNVFNIFSARPAQVFDSPFHYNFVMDTYVLFQDKSKDKVSKFDTLRHSIAGIIRSPKSVLGSSSVSFITESAVFSINTSSFLS